MKICPKCRGFYFDEDTECQNCKIELYDKNLFDEIENELYKMGKTERVKHRFEERYQTICKYQYPYEYEYDEEKSKREIEEMRERVRRRQEERAKIDKEQGILRCPKCGSTAVSTGARGFSIVTGFLGAGQTVNRCGNCGHKWKPKG